MENAKKQNNNQNNSPEYEEIAREFDFLYYLLRYGDIARAVGLDLVQHYIQYGASEGRLPQQFFSGAHYLERYPDVKEAGFNPFCHWLRHGRAERRLGVPFKDFEAAAEMLGRPPDAVQDDLVRQGNEIRDRLVGGVLGEMVARASELEPLVAHTWPEIAKIRIPPFHTEQVLSRVVAMYRLQEAAGFRRARFVVLTNRPRWGGGRRMEGHVAHALAALAGTGEVLVMTTEEAGAMPPGRFPDGVRYVEFPRFTEGLQKQSCERLLVEFLRSLQPEAVFNFNSRLMWDAMGTYRHALAASTKLVAGLFCNERTPLGFTTGYPARSYYQVAEHLHAVCPDSHALAAELTGRYKMPRAELDRVVVLEAPVDPAIPVAPAPDRPAGSRPQIFWAGRFDPQKRIDIVYRVAAMMPEADFRMWGEAVIPGYRPLPPKPDNVFQEGVYQALSDLPLHEADAWLYTAEWDGVPSMLLELAMTGVPLVGSRTGGTGEILRDGYCEPIDEIGDPSLYCAALRRVIADPGPAREAALRLREVLIAERTPEAFTARVKAVLDGVPPRTLHLLPPPEPVAPATLRRDDPDLSLVLTVHDETLLSGPTMESARLAVAAAEARGFSVQRIIALDDPTPETEDYFGQPAFDDWRRIRLEQGDLGRARNEVIAETRGHNIAFLDADDLFSENWLAEGMARMAEEHRAGRRVIAHPEINWQFDGGRSIFFNTDQDHPLFTPWFLTVMHLYDSLCLAPREAHETVPYVSRDIPNGLSFQDWQFTVETMAAGWRHVAVRDTIIFKRRRANSLVTESSARKSLLRQLDCMAIDRIAALGTSTAARPTEPSESVLYT